MIPKFRLYTEKDKMQKVTCLVWNAKGDIYTCYHKGINSPTRVKNPILMQSTGLKDKNGVEIFEGDILKIRTRGFAVVKTKDGNSTVKYKSRFNSTTTATLLHFMDMCKVEVIGNIYENKELLEN